MSRTAVGLIVVGCSVGLLGGCGDKANDADAEAPTAAPAASAQVATQAPAAADRRGCQRVLGRCTGQVPCEVTVRLEPDANKRCRVTSLLPPFPESKSIERHRIRLCVNDPVTWTFDNQCDEELELEIGNFRLDEEIIARHIGTEPNILTQPGDAVPFSGLSSVRVSRGKQGTVKGAVNAKHAPRTYKYDIIYAGPGRRRVLLDPESEIYN